MRTFLPTCFIRPALIAVALFVLTTGLAAQPTQTWQAGVDYSVLAPAAGTEVPKGKIEVKELFMYTSPLSRDVQPYLAKWLESKAPDVEYNRDPSIGFPHAAYQARMYYTLKKLGREDLHEKFWGWVFEKEHYPIYHTIRHPDVPGYEKLNAAFAEANGIDKEKFHGLYNSKEIDEQVIDASIGIHRYHLVGTSTFVINGKYCVSVQRLVTKDPIRQTKPEDFQKLFRLINYLAAQEHNLASPR